MCRTSVSLVALMIIVTGSTALFAQSASPPTGGASQLPLGVAAGTLAPDGIGVTVGQSAGAGKMANGPWVDESVIQPLQVGATMPANSVVLTVAGKPFDLNAAVATKPTVLIFYRGGWCPYCNAHLRQLQGSMPALQAMGATIQAFDPEGHEARQMLPGVAFMAGPYEAAAGADALIIRHPASGAAHLLAVEKSMHVAKNVIAAYSFLNVWTTAKEFYSTTGSAITQTGVRP